MALSDDRKEQSIQLVDELKNRIAEGTFGLKGTKAEVEAFLKDLKMRVNRITVDEICTEFEVSEEEEQETPTTQPAWRLEAGMRVMIDGAEREVVRVFTGNGIGRMRVLFDDCYRTFDVADRLTIV